MVQEDESTSSEYTGFKIVKSGTYLGFEKLEKNLLIPSERSTEKKSSTYTLGSINSFLIGKD